jgi:hypothetical protein
MTKNISMTGSLLRARTFDGATISPTGMTTAPPANVGSVYEGTGKTQRELDLARLKALRDTTGLLNESERSTINAILQKYSGRAAGPTPGAGITSNDQEYIRSVAQMGKAFWDAKMAEMRADIFGR